MYCGAELLSFKSHGITIIARPVATGSGQPSATLLPANAAFAILNGVPDRDLRALGFDGVQNHPCHAILQLLPVLPPVSRPSMRTMPRDNPD